MGKLTIRQKMLAGAVCIFAAVLVCAEIFWGNAGREISAGAELSQGEEETVRLPAIMYHGLLKDSKYQGKYVISPDELEQDMQYLQKNGYTPVHMEEVFDWQDGKGDLPEKPILLTFDDGYYNNYVYAWPLAKKYNMKIIISPIGSCTDKFTGANDDHANYSHVTWPQIEEMMDSGLVEFQNHSYNLHGTQGRLGAKKLRSESMEEYRALLTEDIGKLQERFQTETGYTPRMFTFPFGAISDGAEEILWDMGFRGAFTCEERMNCLAKNEEHPVLGRFLRPHGVSGECYFSGILQKGS